MRQRLDDCSQKIVTFQKLVVNAVDVVDGMDTLAVGKVVVRMAKIFIVLDGVKHFIKVFFGVPPVMNQFVVKSEDLRSPKAGGLSVVLFDVLVQSLPRFVLALLHRVKAGRHIGIQATTNKADDGS